VFEAVALDKSETDLVSSPFISSAFYISSTIFKFLTPAKMASLY
jgi:hypothetical protein